MLTKSQIVDRCTRPILKVVDEDLRRLPYFEAEIYGRVSGPAQVRDSRESLREIGRLVRLAIEDGYRTNLEPAAVEKWLEGISNGSWDKGVIKDGQVTVDVRDLGISGQLDADEREGLAAIQSGVNSGRIGALYVTEGVSRLARDADRVLPYQLLRQLKAHKVRVRTPEGIWNPAIERDWEYLADEFEQASTELRVMGKRLLRRKAQKAARGEFVGEPVPPGFIVPVVRQRPNGQYEYGKLTPYPPHADITNLLLEKYVRFGGSALKTLRSSRDLVYPFFPPELTYMEHLSSLRKCKKLANGYEISPVLLHGLATNPKMIGIWRWGSAELIPDNHPAIVPEELFSQAFELANRKGKPRGRAADSEPLEWAGLVHCLNHPGPRRVTGFRVKNYYACVTDYEEAKGPLCLYIIARFLDEPLSQAVLDQLELGPCVEDVIGQLESDAKSQRLGVVRDRQQISRLEKQIRTYKALLPCCVDEATGTVDKEKEALYWTEIRAAENELRGIRNRPVPAATAAVPDYATVRDFLRNLPKKWHGYSRSSRNRLLRAMIDRVELRGTADIQATIYWKAGMRQEVMIHRQMNKRLAERLWTPVEQANLQRLYPAAPRKTLQEAFPGRNWKAIALKAWRMGLTRKRLANDDIIAGTADRTVSGGPVEEALQYLHVTSSGSRSVVWEVQNLNPLQRLPSERLKKGCAPLLRSASPAAPSRFEIW